MPLQMRANPISAAIPGRRDGRSLASGVLGGPLGYRFTTCLAVLPDDHRPKDPPTAETATAFRGSGDERRLPKRATSPALAGGPFLRVDFWPAAGGTGKNSMALLQGSVDGHQNALIYLNVTDGGRVLTRLPWLVSGHRYATRRDSHLFSLPPGSEVT